MNIKDYLEQKRIAVDRFLDEVTPPAVTPPTTLECADAEAGVERCAGLEPIPRIDHFFGALAIEAARARSAQR